MQTPAIPPATLWAETFVAALQAAGLKHVVIAPGSRSTPLTLAFFRQEGLRLHRAIDERGAAFFALGLGLASGEPAAVVCTSGTAAAEFYPAVLEAEAAEVPLLLLTADRPPELRASGANQTTDQVKLYGGHVRWFVDVALPEAEPAPRALGFLRSLAARALAAAQGFQTPPGAVHLNFPFRKPLEPPTPAAFPPRPDGTLSPPRLQHGRLLPAAAQTQALTQTIRTRPRGLILCGPRTPGGDFPAAVSALAQAAGYPLLAEAVSGVRFGAHVGAAPILGGYENYLDAMPAPQVVLRFGALPVGRKTLAWLRGLPPETEVVHISASGAWQDESYRLDTLLRAEPRAVCDAVRLEVEAVSLLGGALRGQWLCAWQERETAHWQAHRRDWVPALLEALPQPANLFAASSLAVRYLGEQAAPSRQDLRIYANRGLSGIDGTLASAAGLAAESRLPTLALIGDLAFLHDLNSLHLIRRLETPFAILLLNDDGGGIFRRLPIAAHEPPFTTLFRMPHGMTFEGAASQFGLDYAQITTQEALPEAVARAFRLKRPALIEWLIQPDNQPSTRNHQ